MFSSLPPSPPPHPPPSSRRGNLVDEDEEGDIHACHKNIWSPQ